MFVESEESLKQFRELAKFPAIQMDTLNGRNTFIWPLRGSIWSATGRNWPTGTNICPLEEILAVRDAS